jgi:glycosyltransferase involved in cell wall biosynthesis
LRKVLVIPSWYPPDGGQFFQDHAEALAGAGFQVDVLVNRIIGLTKLKFSELSTMKRFHASDVNGTRVIRSFYLKWPRLELLNILRWADKTEKLFRKYQKAYSAPDIILAHSSIWAGYAASIISSRHGIPYLVIEHRSRFTGMTARAEELVRNHYYPLLKKTFGGASRIIAVSDALHGTLRHFTPADREIMTIPNLVDMGFFNPPATRKRDPFVILSIGRLEHEKGMDLLIKAFGRLINDIPEASLKIVGKGPLDSNLRKMASQVKGADKIQILGKLKPVPLLRKLQQAFGVVLIEAMSTGLPVLATRSGGPETFVTELTGRLVDNDSVDAVYDGLKYVYDHYGDYKCTRIRAYVKRHFSREAVMEKYTSLIREACNDKG